MMQFSGKNTSSTNHGKTQGLGTVQKGEKIPAPHDDLPVGAASDFSGFYHYYYSIV